MGGFVFTPRPNPVANLLIRLGEKLYPDFIEILSGIYLGLIESYTQAYPACMPNIIKEHYHVYNRGAHKAPIFLDRSDYERFLLLLYRANDSRTPRVDLRMIKPAQMFLYPRNTLTDIFAYCLMPNHFHIAVREKTENGISTFVHKLCTSYSMYYNKKYGHSGTLFQGQYKIKHVDSDEYWRYLIQYIHLNPFGIEEPDLNTFSKTEHIGPATEYSKTYEFSSFKEYFGAQRPQKGILSHPG